MDGEWEIVFEADTEVEMHEKQVAINSIGCLVGYRARARFGLCVEAARLGVRISTLKHYDDEKKELVETQPELATLGDMQTLATALRDYVGITEEDVLLLSVMNVHSASVRIIESEMAVSMLESLLEQNILPEANAPRTFGFQPDR